MTWIKKQIGPGIYEVTTLDDAEQILTSESKVALGYLNFWRYGLSLACYNFFLLTVGL